ncbi:hypothetical protein Pla123a_06510 [Posidoniimonas polymericola]|uniref:Uncharacterized protein n=1 Tax=Posidoniimonas polymericola TaxID=2528002 RepID=A0A5C5ZEQ2_9BACT|nr:hypothetical protein [Posidoniimonas polymericola]TWT85844.1 hypothetical protein Pla123a_06510 [Posidoniimonas polymericola]
MVFAPALLLFTTLTSVGLIAAWAATSTRHWFVRTMAFLAVASLPLLIPAYEMFVAFVLQGLVVALGVQAWRWRRRDRADRGGSRFALRDALLAVVPLAWVLAAFAAQEEFVFLDLLSPAMVGFAFGLTTLLALWASRGGLQRWSLALLGTVIVAVPLAFFEQTLPEVRETLEWTYDGEQKILDALLVSTNSFDVHLEWLVVSIGVAVAVAVLTKLCFLGTPGTYRSSSRLRLGTGVALALLTVAPLLYMLARLTHRTPIPECTLPDPNGFEDYLQAASALPASPTVDTWAFDVDTATTPQLQAVVAEVDQALELVRSGVTKDVFRRLTYTMEDLDVPDFGGLRTLSRGFAASGRLHEKQGRLSDAVDDYLTVLDYGCSLTRGGLMVDTLIGIACSGMGVEPLRELKHSAPRERLGDIVERLEAAELRVDAIDQIMLRDKVWSQRAMG